MRVGSYHYVRLEFCKYQNTENIKFQAGNMIEPYSFGQSSCTVNSLRQDPPLLVNEGDKVILFLYLFLLFLIIFILFFILFYFYLLFYLFIIFYFIFYFIFY